MARVDTLGHFLTDVADAIRAKKGSSDTIQASDFDTEIENLPSGGGGTIDWSEIGYSGEPQVVINDFNYSKTLYDNWTENSSFAGDGKLVYAPLVDMSNRTSLQQLFMSCTSLQQIPLLDTSNCTDFGNFAYGCSSLKNVALLDLSKATKTTGMFQSCSKLEEIPAFDLSKVENAGSMFKNMTSLTTVPVLNGAKMTYIGNMFQNDTKLSDESLNNILAFCMSMTSFAGNKTLQSLGITNNTLKAKVPNCANYQAFLDAGWTIS